MGPLMAESGHSTNRRNGYECSLPDDLNTRLADSCSAQRYFRYVPTAATRIAIKVSLEREALPSTGRQVRRF